jgi:lipoic acid synthetase
LAIPPTPPLRKPAWLRRPLAAGGEAVRLERALAAAGLHTICAEGRCPNKGECLGRGVATFLILGPVCTRACAFCAVTQGRPAPPDAGEPARLATQVAALSRAHGLAFVVVTSVTRDDLPDGGAAHFAATLAALRREAPGVGVELLVPDFAGDAQALATVVAARPEVLAHNLETVPRLYPAVRRGADYARSLTLLARAARAAQDMEHGMEHDAPALVVKSGLVLGLGERADEVRVVLADLRGAGCTALTLGQYLAPGPGRHPVREYVAPEVFAAYEAEARAMGFAAVAAGPYVRSSYLAEGQYQQARRTNPA